MECFLTFYKEAASCRLKQKFFSGRRGRGCCKPPLIRPLVIGLSICEQKIHLIISFPSPSTPPSPSPPPHPLSPLPLISPLPLGYKHLSSFSCFSDTQEATLLYIRHYYFNSRSKDKLQGNQSLNFLFVMF